MGLMKIVQIHHAGVVQIQWVMCAVRLEQCLGPSKHSSSSPSLFHPLSLLFLLFFFMCQSLNCLLVSLKDVQFCHWTILPLEHLNLFSLTLFPYNAGWLIYKSLGSVDKQLDYIIKYSSHKIHLDYFLKTYKLLLLFVIGFCYNRYII